MDTQFIVISALLCIIIAQQILIARGYARLLQQSVAILQQDLVNAVQSVLENAPDTIREQFGQGLEPANPLIEVFADMIRTRIEPPKLEVTEIKRSDDGKFA